MSLSTGALFFAWPENSDLKSAPSQFCSPTISVASWMFCPIFASAVDTRHSAVPPEPPSCMTVSATRSSNAPMASAPLPAYEQPVTATFFGSIPVAGSFSSASMIRLAPQAQQTFEPALAAAVPYRVLTSPVVGIILFCAANVLVVRLMLATLLGNGPPDPSHLMTTGLPAPAAPPPL